MQRFGGVEKPLTKYEHDFQTKYGNLWIKIAFVGRINSVFMRFTDKDFNMAKFITETGATGINPYSYKWNIHAYYLEEAYDTLSQRLKEIIL